MRFTLMAMAPPRKDTLDFKWEDSFQNSGSGTITRAGENVVVSMKTTRVVESRCLAFYGQNLCLKRVKRECGMGLSAPTSP